MPSIGGSQGGSPSGDSGFGGGGPPGFGLSSNFSNSPAPTPPPSSLLGWLNRNITREDPLNALFPGLGWGMNKIGMLNDTRGNVSNYGGGDPNAGGGPTDFLRTSTMVQKALAAPAPVAPIPPKTPVIPAPTPPRKRVGRQETILTSGLAEATTFKPTLLGQ